MIERFQRRYEGKKGEEDSHYNMHIWNHVYESRKKTGPLWDSSTERFEDLYGEARKMYQKGTMSTGKQVLTNMLYNDNVRHRCRGKGRLLFRPDTTAKCDDTVLWLRNHFYKVDTMEDSRYAIARRMIKKPFSTADVGLDLPWHKAGVYLRGEVENKRLRVDTWKADGKGLLILDKYLFSYPRQWLIS